MSLAAYPGSFDPPTIAHRAVVEAALGHVDRVALVLSEDPLGKPRPAGGRSVDHRRRVLEAATRDLSAVEVRVSPGRLVVDIAEESGADAIVVGSDKWAQVVEPAWYGSEAARDDVLRRLPLVLLAPRAGAPPAPAPPALVEIVVLDVPDHVATVSSTRARAGETDLMLPAARASGLWT